MKTTPARAGISRPDKIPDSTASPPAPRAVDFWNSIYDLMLRRGLGHHDAQDITQGLFLKLTRSGMCERWEQEAENELHLRNLLSRAALNHCRDEHRRRCQLRRGGTVRHCSLDADDVYEQVVCSRPTPCEAANLCEIKRQVVLAIEAIGHRHSGRGRAAHFEAAISCLLDEGSASKKDAAQAIKLDGNAFRALLYRIRRELAGALRSASAA
jgi:DNA-directed RNA polymerase specialized sigma24 family protein